MDKDRIILLFVLFYSFGQIVHGQHIDGFDLTIYQVKINNTPIKKWGTIYLLTQVAPFE